MLVLDFLGTTEMQEDKSMVRDPFHPPGGGEPAPKHNNHDLAGLTELKGSSEAANRPAGRRHGGRRRRQNKQSYGTRVSPHLDWQEDSINPHWPFLDPFVSGHLCCLQLSPRQPGYGKRHEYLSLPSCTTPRRQQRIPKVRLNHQTHTSHWSYFPGDPTRSNSHCLPKWQHGGFSWWPGG